MKQRNIWIRKKKEKGQPSKFVVEGLSSSGKKIFIWTISNDLHQLIQHLIKTSFFTREKSIRIQQKLDSLGLKEESSTKPTPKVPIRKIKRTPKKDYLSREEQINQLWEITK